jgi:hypothetical protein
MPSYTLTNNASDIDSALSRVVAAETVPSTASQNMVTSGGVKNYVDTEVSALETSIVAVETDVAALQATVNSLNTFATLTLPTTSYSDSRTVTGWVESDPNGYINYNSNGTFSLNINTLAKTGKYLATLVLTAFDADGGSDAHSLEFYRNGVLINSMTIPLNNAQNTNGGVRFISWDIENNQSWYVRMFESPTNTVTTLSNTSITITKYV